MAKEGKRAITAAQVLHMVNFHVIYILDIGLYALLNIVHVIKTRMRWAGHVARIGEGRGVYRFFVGKTEEERPLGRPRHRWENNIGMDLQEVGCGCEDWIG
jgi:hypothetical protein